MKPERSKPLERFKMKCSRGKQGAPSGLGPLVSFYPGRLPWATDRADLWSFQKSITQATAFLDLDQTQLRQVSASRLHLRKVLSASLFQAKVSIGGLRAEPGSRAGIQARIQPREPVIRPCGSSRPELAMPSEAISPTGGSPSRILRTPPRRAGGTRSGRGSPVTRGWTSQAARQR